MKPSTLNEVRMAAKVIQCSPEAIKYISSTYSALITGIFIPTKTGNKLAIDMLEGLHRIKTEVKP